MTKLSSSSKYLLFAIIGLVLVAIMLGGYKLLSNYPSPVPQPSPTQPKTTVTTNQDLDRNLISPVKKGEEELIIKVKEKGRLKIIVGLNINFKPEGELNDDEIEKQRLLILQTQDTLIQELSQYNVEINGKAKYIPYIYLNVDEGALQYLINSPTVEGIQEDSPASYF